MAAPAINLLAIVGPTASGKSDFAMKIAKEFNGEIIAADSRTIYKGMDIGTAKPSKADQKAVKHWGIDLIDPGRPYSAASFKDYAQQAIKDIRSRGKLPILVGGTGLYIDAVLYDYQFVSPVGSRQRKILEVKTLQELQKIIRTKGYKMPENKQNKRYLIRTIERKGELGSRKASLASNVLLVGLMPNDEELRSRINLRASSVFKKGLVDETKKLIDKYGEYSIQSTGGIAYKTAIRLLAGEIDKKRAKELIQTEEWQYARRQKTWFKRNKFIQWYEDPDQAFTSVSYQLNNQLAP